MKTSSTGLVAVVTGGGRGIGAATAAELGRRGATVIVVDTGAGLGGEPTNEPVAAETAKRIRDAGGRAEASMVSITDRSALQMLFAEISARHGAIDAVINAAGIIRLPRLADAAEEDWSSVLALHLDGYINVLAAALPVMVEAGHGRIVGFTSGVGLARTSVDAIAYGPAKRAVAALTWQLAPLLPAGIALNAVSPIAATRMVRDSLVAGGANPAGLDMSNMPQPEDMAPAVAYLASDDAAWCRGQVLFSAGSELSLIAPPRLVEAVRSHDAADFPSALDTLVPVVLGPAEAGQATTGGSNPRLGDVFAVGPPARSDGPRRGEANCLIVSDEKEIAEAVATDVGRWGLQASTVTGLVPVGFEQALATLSAAGPELRAVVVVLAPRQLDTARQLDTERAAAQWKSLLDAHAGIAAEAIQTHGAWQWAAAGHAATHGRPVRVVHGVEASTPAGRTVAQAVIQMVRAANETPSGSPADSFCVAIETSDRRDHEAVGQLMSRLAGAGDSESLRGAELVAGPGWVGLRRHPGPVATATFGGGAVPDWVGDALRQVHSA